MDASEVMRSGRYPRVAAVNWWAQNKGNGTGYDAYPNTSQTFLDGFKRAFNQPYFDARAQFSVRSAEHGPRLDFTIRS